MGFGSGHYIKEETRERQSKGHWLSHSPSWRLPIFTAGDLWNPLMGGGVVKNPIAKRIPSPR